MPTLNFSKSLINSVLCAFRKCDKKFVRLSFWWGLIPSLRKCNRKIKRSFFALVCVWFVGLSLSLGNVSI